MVALATAGSVARPAHAAVVPGQVVAIEDSIPSGAASPVANVFAPFVNPDGYVSFAGTLDSGEQFVFIDDQVVWLSSEEVESITSIVGDMGSRGSDEFVVRATIDGAAGLWTHDDLLAGEGDPAPGFPLFPTAAFTFSNTPGMDGTGTVYWRGSVDLTNDGGSDVVGLYYAPGADPLAIDMLYTSGDLVDGVTLDGDTSAIRDDFAFSDDGTHTIAALEASGDTLVDQLLVVDGSIVAREGDLVPSFMGEQWSNFDLVSINDDGNYLFSGDTTAPANLDEIVGYNGDVAVHQNDVLDGIGVDFDIRFIALNNRNNALIGWARNELGSVVEVVFLACDASDIAGTAELLLEVGDTIDIDGDMLGDFTVDDVQGSTVDKHHGLGDADAVYLELDLGPGDLNAIVEIPFTCCGNGNVDGGEECDDGNDEETDDCLPTCSSATCGDGVVWEGVEECDDGNGVDDDACPNDCMLESGSSSSGSSTTTDAGRSSSSSSSSSSGGDSGSSSSTGGESTTSGGEAATGTAGDGSGSGSGSESGSASASASGSASASASATTAPPTTGDTDDGGGGVDGDDGCGCAANTRAPRGAWIALLLVAATRRRVRSC
jgi:cysteine-rich repeat protein